MLCGVLLLVAVTSRLASLADQDDAHIIDISVTRLTNDNFNRLTGVVLPYEIK